YTDDNDGILLEQTEPHTVEHVAVDLATPHAVAVDDEFAYWAAKGGTIGKAPLSRSLEKKTLLTDGFEVLALAVDATGIYFTSANGSVRWLSLDGLQTKELATGELGPGDVAI